MSGRDDSAMSLSKLASDIGSESMTLAAVDRTGICCRLPSESDMF
jgi:hypothetical protein